MSWSLRDGSHEGGVASLLEDGSIDLEGLGSELTVDMLLRQGVREADGTDWRSRLVAGWLPACACGWLGSTWFRVDVLAQQDEQLRLVFSSDGRAPGDLEDGAMQAQWREHVLPAWSVDELRARVAEQAAAEQRVDAAVQAAKAAGASWSAIAGAVGVTRQSAHRRWRT